MTREEAIKRLKSDIYEYADFTENPNENEFWMAFEMAIKALESKDVLDKIRVEIENDWQFKKYPSSPFSCGLRRALEIIDKYRAESEEENGTKG